MIQGSNKYQNIFIICWELGQKNDKKKENAILLNRTQPQKVFFCKNNKVEKTGPEKSLDFSTPSSRCPGLVLSFFLFCDSLCFSA